MVVFLELGVTEGHSSLKVPGVDLFSNFLGGLNCLHERSSHDLGLADGDHWRWRLRRHLQNSTDGLDTLQSGEQAVVGASWTTSLGVTQHGGSGVQAQSLREDILDGRARNLVELAILCSLGDNNDCAALSTLLTVLWGEKKKS